MDQTKTTTGYAGRKTAAALWIVLLSALLFGSRGALLTVRAENEMALPAEEMAEEPQTPEDGAAETIQTENPEQAAPAEAENTEEAALEETPLEAMSITMIGDSVMLGAAETIQAVLPNCVIDAKVSRQVKQADAVLTSLESQNALGQAVVIGLGTNGPFRTETGQALIDRLGSARMIYWITAYGRDLSWQEDSNAVIRELASANENVHLIDWAQAAAGHPEWICKDGIHLSAEGQSGYAGVVLGGLSK